MLAVHFCLGQVVHHFTFGFRGVIVGVDPCFVPPEGEGDPPSAPEGGPWYRVLVDGGNAERYVAGCHLHLESDPGPVQHPALAALFDEFRDGRYMSWRHVH